MHLTPYNSGPKIQKNSGSYATYQTPPLPTPRIYTQKPVNQVIPTIYKFDHILQSISKPVVILDMSTPVPNLAFSVICLSF